MGFEPRWVLRACLPVLAILCAGASRSDEAASLDGRIARLEQALPDVPEAVTRAGLLLQLAELHHEKSQLALLAHRPAGPDLGASIRLYQQLLAEFPSYPQRDQVLFLLAACLFDAGRKPEAAARDREVLLQYPGSRFAGDAAVQAGDVAFEASDFAQARKDYRMALGAPDSKVQGYALYKLAWCDFSAGDDAAAIRGFQRVVDYESDAFASGRPGGEQALQLKAAALQDMARAREDLARRSPGSQR